MNKFREMDKKKKITISVIAILILLIGSVIAIYGVSATKSDDNKAKVEKNVKLSEKEENKAKNLESEMDKKLKDAKTEEEKEAIKKEYAEKIETATGGKVTVSSSGKVETTKPSSGSSSGSISKPAKPESEPNKPDSKPENKPSKPDPKPEEKPSKPQHTHSFTIPITKTVTKYKTEWVGKYVCTYDLGVKYFDTNTEAADFQYWCLVNDYSCTYTWKENAVEEQVPYTVEEVVGYKCSCGATQ